MAEVGSVCEVGARYAEQLHYSNPLGQPVVPVWYSTQIFYVIDGDYEVAWTDPPQVPVKEYVFRYGAPDAPGAPVRGQLPVYNLVPGNCHYQPAVELVEVFVPFSYTVNSLRSEDAILTSDQTVISPTGRYYVRPII